MGPIQSRTPAGLVGSFASAGVEIGLIGKDGLAGIHSGKTSKKSVLIGHLVVNSKVALVAIEVISGSIANVIPHGGVDVRQWVELRNGKKSFSDRALGCGAVIIEKIVEGDRSGSIRNAGLRGASAFRVVKLTRSSTADARTVE